MGPPGRGVPAFCPFCPEVVEQVTPKFHPDLLRHERYARGEALCVPNAFPYDENGAVCIMCRQHFLPLKGFTARILKDALSCCLSYLRDVVVNQPEVVYQSVNWNYMPLAGGSIVHPHLQITASSSSTNYYTVMVPALERYECEHGRGYWSDLRDEEFRVGERFIAASEGITWLAAFAPMGVFDVLGVFHRAHDPADIGDELLDEVIWGILRVMEYIDTLNMYSLNMSMYFLLDNERFVPHLRVCPRVSIPPFGNSQINYLRMLHNETLTTLKPEDVCSDLRTIWKE